MPLLQFILSFIGLLVAGPIIIIGWYAITRGRTEYKINGTAYKTGKIFKGWSFFWTQSERLMPINLLGESLAQAVIKIQKEFKVGLTVNLTSGYISCKDTIAEHLMERKLYIEDITKAKVRYVQEDGTVFELLKPELKYKYSELLRDPLSECPTCMASVYGSIIWWAIQWLSNGFMFWWTAHVWLAAIIFWIFFCIGCAFVNTILAKKL